MTRLISRDREKPHSWVTKLGMRLHLDICVWCRRYQNQVTLIGKLCRIFEEESSAHGKDQLSDEAKARLKETLRQNSHD